MSFLDGRQSRAAAVASVGPAEVEGEVRHRDLLTMMLRQAPRNSATHQVLVRPVSAIETGTDRAPGERRCGDR
jgi:hypothetical protein